MKWNGHLIKRIEVMARRRHGRHGRQGYRTVKRMKLAVCRVASLAKVAQHYAVAIKYKRSVNRNLLIYLKQCQCLTLSTLLVVYRNVKKVFIIGNPIFN